MTRLSGIDPSMGQPACDYLNKLIEQAAARHPDKRAAGSLMPTNGDGSATAIERLIQTMQSSGVKSDVCFCGFPLKSGDGAHGLLTSYVKGAVPTTRELNRPFFDHVIVCRPHAPMRTVLDRNPHRHRFWP